MTTDNDDNRKIVEFFKRRNSPLWKVVAVALAILMAVVLIRRMA